MPRKTPEFYFARARRIAIRLGGELLSTEYVSDSAKLRFRCAEGHEFLLPSGALVGGHWCRKCRYQAWASRKRPDMLARLHQIVVRKGGVLLSYDYVNNMTKLRCRCAAGHEWDAIPANIFIGGWCLKCGRRSRGEERRLAVERRIRALARKTRNRLLPPGFAGAHSLLNLRCARGHHWTALCQSFEAGTRCRVCYEEDLLDKLRAIAERHHGVCLAESAKNVDDPLPWRCQQGHEFMTAPGPILKGSWCQKCRSYTPGDLGRMQRIAHARGGECLSTRYVDSATKLRWRCREGHEWAADPGGIVQGTWCPICTRFGGHSRARLTIEIMREMAIERGGECLSDEYHASKVHLRWRCARGHEWVAIPARIRQGDWCPECAHAMPGTLEGMRAIALEKGGRCLSETWDKHRQPLLFECDRHHQFRMNPKVVKTGVWCPTCAGRKVAAVQLKG